jgi:hypothetical protein
MRNDAFAAVRRALRQYVDGIEQGQTFDKETDHLLIYGVRRAS